MKPEILVGCSTGLLRFAHALARGLRGVADVQTWDDGSFGLMSHTLDGLVRAVQRSDLGVFILGVDDLLPIRDNLQYVARDYVIFETRDASRASVFGACVCLVVPENVSEFRLPSDLARGLSVGFESDASDADASVARASREVASAINRLHDAHGLTGDWSHSWAIDGQEGDTFDCALDLLQLESHIRGAYHWNGMSFSDVGAIEHGEILNATCRCSNPQGYSGSFT